MSAALPPRHDACRRAVLLLVALAAITAASRLAGLGDRQPHHDEMVHQWFAERFAFEGDYRASPAYHGPLLYHLQAGATKVFGPGLWQGRLVPALAGIAAALALMGLAAREAGMRAGVAVGVLAAFSPVWTYYARFDNHDTLILLLTTVVAWGRWHWSQGRVRHAAWLIVPALGLAWCTKLNALFVAGAIAAWPVVRRLVSRDLEVRRKLAWPSRATVVAAFATTVLVGAVLFASTFRSILASAGTGEALAATLRAAAVDPIAYWADMNERQRLGGPFHYYVALIALYEPLLVAGAVIAFAGAWRQARRPWLTSSGALALGVLLAAAAWPFEAWTTAWLHVAPVHLAVLPAAGAGCWLLARGRARAGDEAGVWWVWMGASQLLLYSYAGEKVPWLAVHVMLPWLMIAGTALARAWTGVGNSAGVARERRWPTTVVRAAVATGAAASIALTAWGQYAVVAWTGSDPAEPLVQLEYAPDTHHLLRQLVEVCPTLERGDGPCLQTTPDAAWPAEWYLRHAAGTHVGSSGLEAPPTTPFVFVPARRTTPDLREQAERLAATHEPHAVRFSMWGTWVEWLQHPRPGELAAFWWHRRSLGPRRGVAYELWVRRDIPAPIMPVATQAPAMTEGSSER